MIQVIHTLLVVFAYLVIVEENILPMIIRQGDGLQQSIMVHFAFTMIDYYSRRRGVVLAVSPVLLKFAEVARVKPPIASSDTVARVGS
jgi:hypothetical protein